MNGMLSRRPESRLVEKASLRILLFGIYDLGFRSLEAMLDRNLKVVGLVTKPDCLLQAQPLTCLARDRSTPILAPVSPRDASFLSSVRLLKPDLIVVSGYHKILPPSLLGIPRRGVLNLHASLLPKRRGPCPWKWALMAGETVIGATVHRMSADLDRGDILAQAELPIDPDDTAETLFHRLCEISGPLLAKTVEDYAAGVLIPKHQEEGESTYQGYPTDEDARIRWEWTTERIRNLIRGLSPRPGAWTQYGGKRIRVLHATPAEKCGDRFPGQILGRTGDTLLVSTGDGTLCLSGLSVEGEDPSARPQTLQTVGLIPGSFFDPAEQAVS